MTSKRDKIDPARKRWVKTEVFEFIHYDIPEGTRDRGEGAWEGWGNTHTISIVKRRGREKFFSFDLTMLSLEEIRVVKEFFDLVLAEAEQVCEHRDNKAREAWDNGQDDFFRLYRTVPKLVERPRQEQQHDPGV